MKILISVFIQLLFIGNCFSQVHLKSKVLAIIKQEIPNLVDTYKHLHANPELSHQEKETASYLVSKISEMGLPVTSNIGGNGIVAVLKNGTGPTIMVRTDMDALPIKEETGLPYASEVKVKGKNGQETAVMHACGHDFHMTIWLGVINVLKNTMNNWKGTIVFVGQPAEETGEGARAMLEDGLFTRFPKPNVGLALHVNPALKAGTVGLCPGYALSNVDNVTILVKGEGGHGAIPHKTIDPVVLSSKIILSLQTIVSRELSPIESPAVITVGAIHGGTVGNIIPNEVELKLTVRSFGQTQRQLILDKINRVCKGLALSSGLSEENYPTVAIQEKYTPSVYNNPELTESVSKELKMVLGDEQVIKLIPEMVGEDFSNYNFYNPNVPTLIYSLGTSEESARSDANFSYAPVHSSKFYPQIDPSLKIGVLSMSMAVLKLLEGSGIE